MIPLLEPPRQPGAGWAVTAPGHGTALEFVAHTSMS
jgi:hypothetical protein